MEYWLNKGLTDGARPSPGPIIKLWHRCNLLNIRFCSSSCSINFVDFPGFIFYSMIHFWGLIQIEIYFLLSKEIFSGFRRTFKIVNQKYFMCLFISGSSDKELSFIITKLWANKSSSLSICFVCFVSVENQKRKF